MSESNRSPKTGAADAGVVEHASPESKRILLVEGDGFTRLVLLLRLRLAGFAVDFTSNGILGLGKIRNCHPDVLLVELKLCGLSGLELIKAARAEPGFGKRPIYVFTHAERMSRAVRKEVDSLATKVLDKKSVTREELVQIFASTFLNREPAAAPSASSAGTGAPAAMNEKVLSGAVGELIAGVQEQTKRLAREKGSRAAGGGELLSRVSSLASCASAAGLRNLARQANALDSFLNQLSRHEERYTNAALATVDRAVQVMAELPVQTGGRKQSLSRYSAVFVDEAPYSNRAMEEALLKAGFEPVCFENSVRAQEYLAINRADLIIANVVLPEAHGLALSDIRRLPLHKKTPVIFGPESSFAAPLRGELPTSAPRLDRSPVLLAEIVIRSLNEVQSPAGAASSSAPATAIPAQAPQDPPTALAPAGLSEEDGFELFTRGPQKGEELATVSEPENLSAPVAGMGQPWSQSAESPPQELMSPESPPPTAVVAGESEEPFNQFINPGAVPLEPNLPAQPGSADADLAVESPQQLEVNTVDGVQTEEPTVEAPAPTAFAAEETQPPQPELAAQDQTATTEWIAADVGTSGEGEISGSYDTQLEHREATTVQASAGGTSNYTEDMNNRLQTVPASQGNPGEAVDSRMNQQGNLAARVCTAEMALYQAQKQIEEKDNQIGSLQAQLAGAHSETNPAVEQSAKARCAELEGEVAALRQALEGLNGDFSAAQQPSAEAAKQVQELEQRLNERQAELEKNAEERQRAEVDLRQQLEAAQQAGRENEEARQRFEARSTELEQQVAGLRQAQEEAAQKAAKSAETLASTTGASRAMPACELDQQVRQGVSALAHATAELAKERGDRQRSQQLAAELNSRLQALHTDLSRTLQNQGEHLARITSLEQQHQQTSQALERCKADLEQQQAERGLAETQLQKAKEANALLRKDLSFFEETNNKYGGARQELHSRLETSLNAARENEARLQQEAAERRRLEQTVEETKRELQNQARKREILEQEMQSVRDALQERENRLQQEVAERQRLNENLDSAQRGLRDGPERDLEFSKLQAALQSEQVERKRQETQLARMRQSTLDAAHSARALRTSMRRQVREPVDGLVHSARSLLELEMGEEQKKLAEAVLQDVLLVQTRLREPAAAHDDASEPAAPSTNAA